MTKPSKPPSARVLPVAIAALIAIATIAGVLLVRRGGGASANGSAATEITLALAARGYTSDVEAIAEACSGTLDCPCAEAAASRALNRNLHAEATALLGKVAEACAGRPALAGLLAEAQARAGDLESAQRSADEVLAAHGENGEATYALAHIANAQGDVPRAEQLARQAVERGRVQPAQLLLGLIAFRRGDLPGARAAFTKLTTEDPRDVDALYNLAVVAGAENKYREAREGYLAVLALAPKHADSRYNLIVLTHSVAAKDEAAHHHKKLLEIVPEDDDRAKRAKVLLATAPPPTAGPPPPAQPAPAPLQPRE